VLTHPVHQASYTVPTWASRWGCSSVPGFSRKCSGFLWHSHPLRGRLAVTCNALSAGRRIMVPRSSAGPIRNFSSRDHYVASSRFMTCIPVSQGTHAGHTQGASTGNADGVSGSRVACLEMFAVYSGVIPAPVIRSIVL